jgi:exopolysaccharide biosynthesis polyprenyl glycosylphosphotransferase
MQIYQLMDACLFALSFWLAFAVRSNDAVSDFFGVQRVAMPFDQYVVLYVLLIAAAPLVLEAQGFYNRSVLGLRRRMLWPLFKACVFLSLGVVLGLFLLRLSAYVARGVVVWFAGLSFALVVAKEELLRLGLRSRLAGAQYRRRFILVGVREELARTRLELAQAEGGELEILGQVELEKEPVSRLVELLHEHSVNGVVVSARRAYFEPVEAVIRACELEGVEVWLVADFFQTQISRTSLDDFNGRPVLVFRSAPEVSWEGVAKGALDYVLAGFLFLAVLVPLMAVVGLLVRLSSPGPVLFRQQRSGLNGRPFTMYKFRTMVSNAEQLKDELAALNEMNGPVFKLSKDPRITKVGRMLRRYSIDELPQLVNVLRGEMSLVGPRPLPVDEVKRFDDLAHRRRLSVKPGLTCLWQVSGRNDLRDFREWVRLDLEYIDHWSFWLDLKILCRTVPAVLRGAGAR